MADQPDADRLSPLVNLSQGSLSSETVSKSPTSPPDAVKEPCRNRSDSAAGAEDFNHKLKIFFPDRTYRNILCSERITAAEVKRRLLNRMQLPKDNILQLVHSTFDGSNFRVIFDSEFLETEELRPDDVKAHPNRRSYISSASVSNDVKMVYLAKIVPSVKEGEADLESTSAAIGRGYLSRRKPSSDRHRRYFFQLWRVKQLLAMFKVKDEVHSVISLSGSHVRVGSDSDVEFTLRVPGAGDYSFIAESRMERDEWMWVLSGVNQQIIGNTGAAGFNRSPAGDLHLSGSKLMRSTTTKTSSAMVFEGFLHKNGLGMGKFTFQPRRVRIQNGMLLYYKPGQDNAHPSGVIILKHCKVSSFVRPGTSEPYGFIVNAVGRDYQFATSDPAERDRWMTGILSICSTLAALSQGNISTTAFDLQPVLPQVVSIKAIVERCLEYFKGKPPVDIETQPWFGNFSEHMAAVVQETIEALMIDSSPVRLYLCDRLSASATQENCHRVISLCLQQLIMPAILPELLVQLGFPHGQFEPIIDHFAAKCQLLIQHPNIFESLNLPSRECSYEMGIKLMSKLPLLTDPHALLSSLVAIIDSAQSDHKMLMGSRAPVLTGDHMFCLLLYFILKASPAPHHLLSEVVSLLNSPFDLEGPRGYIAATYCAAVSYVLSFSSSLQRKTDVEFVLASKTLRHAPSKRFTKRLASVGLGASEISQELAQPQPQPPVTGLVAPVTAVDAEMVLPHEAVLAAADVDASSSDDEGADFLVDDGGMARSAEFGHKA